MDNTINGSPEEFCFTETSHMEATLEELVLIAERYSLPLDQVIAIADVAARRRANEINVLTFREYSRKADAAIGAIYEVTE